MDITPISASLLDVPPPRPTAAPPQPAAQQAPSEAPLPADTGTITDVRA